MTAATKTSPTRPHRMRVLGHLHTLHREHTRGANPSLQVLTRRAATAAIIIAVAAAHAAPSPTGWKTYQSDRFGYELSYPPDMKLEPYFEGRSSELRDAATGAQLVQLDIWPGDLCPRERAGTTAKALGLERAVAITQADGDDGSSWCGKPVTVREGVSSRGVRFYELELTCRSEHTVNRRVVRESLGKKGPTFFADVSQPWLPRVLMVDPVGADPRMGPGSRKIEPALVRQILETLATLPVQDPHVVCIDDLVGRQGAIAMPGPPAR